VINPRDPASVAARLAKVEAAILRHYSQLRPLKRERRILLNLLTKKDQPR
jgi:hypothetical protein